MTVVHFFYTDICLFYDFYTRVKMEHLTCSPYMPSPFFAQYTVLVVYLAIWMCTEDFFSFLLV